MAETVSADVLLRVPARASYARIVRVGAAALALRQGLSFGEIDDLRLAIDEAMIVLLDGVDDDDSTDIEVVFRVVDGHFELEAVRSGASTTDHDGSEAAVHRFEAIAKGLVDECEIDLDRGWLRLRKTPVGDDD